MYISSQVVASKEGLPLRISPMSEVFHCKLVVWVVVTHWWMKIVGFFILLSLETCSRIVCFSPLMSSTLWSNYGGRDHDKSYIVTEPTRWNRFVWKDKRKNGIESLILSEKSHDIREHMHKYRLKVEEERVECIQMNEKINLDQHEIKEDKQIMDWLGMEEDDDTQVHSSPAAGSDQNEKKYPRGSKLLLPPCAQYYP